MSVLEYIILSFALTVPVMVTLRACALKNPIRLTRGLGVSFLVALVHVLLILAGIYIGNLLRFELAHRPPVGYSHRHQHLFRRSRTWLSRLFPDRCMAGCHSFACGHVSALLSRHYAWPYRQEHPRPSLAAYRSPLPARFCHQRRLLCRLKISQYISIRYTCRKHVILESI